MLQAVSKSTFSLMSSNYQSIIQCGRYQLTFCVTVSEQKFLQTVLTGEGINNQSGTNLKSENGNFSVWNKNFRAKISDFLGFFAERKILLRTLPRI